MPEATRFLFEGAAAPVQAAPKHGILIEVRATDFSGMGAFQ
jgi:hypothetical protein